MAFRCQFTAILRILIVGLVGVVVVTPTDRKETPLLFQSASLDDFRDSVVHFLPTDGKLVAQQPKGIPFHLTFIPPEFQEKSVLSTAPQQFFHFREIPLALESSKRPRLHQKDDHKETHHNTDESHHHGTHKDSKKSSKGGKLSDSYEEKGGEKKTNNDHSDYNENTNKGEKSKELHKTAYEVDTGNHYNHEKDGQHGGEHHSGKSAGQKKKFKSSGQKSKGDYEKGFHDIYHKDEQKKHDSYFSNNHEEGKILHFGSGYKKHGKKGGGKKAESFADAGKSEKENDKKGKSAHGHNKKDNKKYEKKGGGESAHENNVKFAKSKTHHDAKSYNVKQ